MSQESTLRGLVFGAALMGLTVAVAAQPQAPAPPAPPGVVPGAAVAAPQAPAGAGRQGGRGAPTPVVIGPSAPVPPEVAMLRPSAEELAQINAAVTRFIGADQSPTKPLLQKYESLKGIIAIIGESELSSEDRDDYNKAKQLIEFFKQRFNVMEKVTGVPGEHMTREKTLDGVEAIIGKTEQKGTPAATPTAEASVPPAQPVEPPAKEER